MVNDGMENQRLSLSPTDLLSTTQAKDSITKELGPSSGAMYEVLLNMADEEQNRGNEISEISWALVYSSTELLELMNKEISTGNYTLAREFFLPDETGLAHAFAWNVYSQPNSEVSSGRPNFENRLRGFAELRYFIHPEKEDEEIHLEVNYESESLKPMVSDLERVFGKINYPVSAEDRSWGKNKFTWVNQALREKQNKDT